MSEQYYKQSVEIHIDRDSELFKRIKILAEKIEKPIDEVFSWAVLLGIEKHLDERLCVLEKIHGDI